MDERSAALAIDPKYKKALYNRGNAKEELGDHAGAVEDYTAALAPYDTDTGHTLQAGYSSLFGLRSWRSVRLAGQQKPCAFGRDGHRKRWTLAGTGVAT